MGGVPRPLQIIEREGRNLPPLGRRTAQPAEVADALRPQALAVAAGQLPLDDNTAQLLAHVLANDYARVERTVRRTTDG